VSTNVKLLLGLGGLVLLGVGLLAGLSGGIIGMDHSGSQGQQVAEPVPRARPAGDVLVAGPASAVDTEVLRQVGALPGVAGIDRYLVGTLADGTPVVGLESVSAPLISPDGRVLTITAAVGRPLEAAAARGPIALVGVEWARTHETIYGYQVAGMIGDHVAPVLLADGTEVTVVDVVSAGDERADAAVFVPLNVAEQLLAGAASEPLLGLRLDEGADREAVRRAVEAAGLQILDGGR
jgi:hypothetical protein